MNTPYCCPYCRRVDTLREIVAWEAETTDKTDAGNSATLMEWQCHSPVCEGRSFWLPDTRKGPNPERAAEVAKIVAHAKTKSHMTAADDAVARPLGDMLVADGIITGDYFLEWQGAWEHDVAAYFWGDDHCLNVNADGSITEAA